MSCTIVRDENNNITKVLGKDGLESQLFIQIAKSPLVEDTEQALNIYKNVYVGKLNNLDEDSIGFGYKIEGDPNFYSYQQALKTAKNGQEIKAGFTTQVSTEKQGVQTVFKDNPELTKLGTVEEYSAYLDTIFPESKVKDILYHGTKRNFQDFDESQIGTAGDALTNNGIGLKGKGFYFTKNLTRARGYSLDMQTGIFGKVFSAVLDIQNIQDDVWSYLPSSNNLDEVVARSKNQIHILGSEKDIQEFKNWKESAFTEIITTVKNTNKDTESGYINANIESGILAEEKIRVGNEYRFTVNGESELKLAVNSELLVNDAGSYLGFNGLQRDANTMTLAKTKNKSQVTSKNDEVSLIDTNEFNEMSIEDIQKRFDYSEELVAGRFFADNRPAQRETKITEDKILHRNERELQLRLLSFLNKLGVKVTSISEYVNNYTIKNDVAPNAQALADISNRIIAFNAGAATLENLTEETAHFIIEATPKAQTEDILRNINRSEEYQQYADTYRQVYSKEYTGEQLEEAVRREVLGKILANSIASNFAQENKTQEQINFIDKVLEFFNNFFQTVSAYFKPEYVNELNDYLEDVENLLLKDDLSFESLQLEENPFRFYALDPNPDNPENKLVLRTRKTAQEINRIGRSLKKSGAISKSDRLKLKNLEAQLEETASVQSVATLVSISNNIANYLAKALEDSKLNNKNYALSQEEVVLYEFMSKDARDAMGQIGELVRDKQGKDWETLRSRISETQRTISTVVAEKSLVSNQTVDNLVDEILKRGGYPESSRQFFEKHINNLDVDANLLVANVGTLINSKNPLLGLLARSITNMHNEGHQNDQNALKKLQNIIKSNGLTEKIISTFGSKNGYILSQYDFSAHEQAHNKAYIQAFRQVIPDSTLTDEEIIEKKLDRTLDIDESQRANIDRIERNISLEENLDEKPRVKSYYEEQNRKYSDAGISEDTIIWNSSYLSSVGNILKNAKNENGITDRTLLSLQDQYALETLERDRYFVKSYYTEAGILKDGLELQRDAQGNLIKDEQGKTQVQAIPGQQISQEALIALELNKLDSLNVFGTDVKFIEKYRSITGDNSTSDADILAGKKNNTLNLTADQKDSLYTLEELPQSFYDLIQEIDDTRGREEAIKALNMNSFIGFKDAFWSNPQSDDLSTLLENAKADNPSEVLEIQDIIDSIDTNRASIRAILKLWAKKGSPSEISQDITQASKDNIRDYQELLDSAYEKSKKYVKREFTESVSEGISEANEAFEKELRDLEIEIKDSDTTTVKLDKLNKQIDEIVKNTTAVNKSKLLNDKYQIERYRAGQRDLLPLNIERLSSEQGYDLKNDEDYIAFMKLYAESKLLPYYKRYAPINYSSFTENLRTVSDLTGYIRNTLESSENLIDITPHYSFYDSEQSATINPNYDVTSKAGSYQPNLNKFRNNEFYNKFGQTVKTVNGRIDVSTSSNPKLAQVYNAYLDYNEAGLDAMGMRDTGYNYYTMPQMRKSGLERDKATIAGLSGERLRLALRDAFNYNQEEQVQGESYNNIYVIPQPYVQKLKDNNDLATEDLFYTTYMRSREGYLRQAKENYYGEINSIQDAVLLRDYNGKAPQSTNIYKQIKAVSDYQLFGIKEEVTLPFKTALGTFSGAKIVKTFMKFISLKNLGFSPIISITSAGTMKLAQISERWAGQFIQQSTFKLASREFGKLVTSSLSELGQVNTEAKLNVLGQYFQAFDLNEGLRNSQYGWLARSVKRSPMMMYQMAAYPFYAQNMLHALYDYRVVNDKVMSFQTFKQINRRQGKSAKQVEIDWKQYENNPIYNYIDVNNGQVEFNKQKLGQVLNLSGENLEKEIQDISNEVRAATKNLNVRIDLQLPTEEKVGIQRNFLWNLLLTHKGYIIPLTESRFKPQQFNSQTKSLEEGSYRSAYNYMGGVIREWRSNGGNILKAFKDEWSGINKDAESWEEVELRQANIRRVGKDLVIANALMLLSLLVRGFSDDPSRKEVWSLQATNLILARLNNEFYTSQQGIYTNYTQILESPVLAYSTAQQLGGIFDSDKTFKTIQKNTPLLNSYIKLRDPRQQFESLRYQTEVKNNTFALAPMHYLFPSE